MKVQQDPAGVVVRDSKVDRKGLFSTIPISRHTVLGEFTGKIVKLATLTLVDADYVVAAGGGVGIDAADDLTCLFRYMNHSYQTPNCRYLDVYGDGRMYVVSTVAIAAGEELLSNYGTGYWEGRQPPS